MKEACAPPTGKKNDLLKMHHSFFFHFVLLYCSKQTHLFSPLEDRAVLDLSDSGQQSEESKVGHA